MSIESCCEVHAVNNNCPELDKATRLFVQVTERRKRGQEPVCEALGLAESRWAIDSDLDRTQWSAPTTSNHTQTDTGQNKEMDKGYIATAALDALHPLGKSPPYFGTRPIVKLSSWHHCAHETQC